MKCELIDFKKYKDHKTLEVKKLYDESYLFRCPDCNSDNFKLFLDCTAECVDCGLDVLIGLTDDEL